jgi:peroxiredoxin
MKVGEQAPDFELHDTDGDAHSLMEGGGWPAVVVVFTCNHCPYALAWHERILDTARDYAEQGVRFLLVNPNDADRYPDDSPEAMQERVREEGGWPAPYMHDETQEVARVYGAKTTPDVFVVDGEGRLRYRGAPDSDHREPSQNAGWLREALDAVIAGQDPPTPETEPVGCSVKWKSDG